MHETTQAEPTGRATYCPEDNKLRLYVGRVPREEFLKLRAEGWTTLHKQRDAGGGDFAATWTPERRDAALAYAGLIEDEDMGPEERAADRAERFGIYRDKRADEAVAHADRYDSGPAVHGFQNHARAVRAADRHDKQAGRAVDAWDTAEYWTRRTAGVIAHALHVSSPSVRMGRIKTLEAEARKIQASREEYCKKWKRWKAVAGISDAEEQTKLALYLSNFGYDWTNYTHPRTGAAHRGLYDMLREAAPDRITGAEACALYFSRHTDPESDAWHDTRPAQWARHYALRIAYENQMLEAQGGRAASVEMEPGGWLRGGRHLSAEWRQIQKVNKSPKTGRVTSVLVRDNHPSSRNHWGNPFPDGITKTLCHEVKTERLAPDVYRAPTDEERAAFKAAKKSAPKGPALVNLTDEDAERLQAEWNRAAAARGEYSRAPGKVWKMTQAEYSRYSGDWVGTCIIHGVRVRRRGSISGADHVIVITDKPRKALPAATWAPAAGVQTVSAAADLVLS